MVVGGRLFSSSHPKTPFSLLVNKLWESSMEGMPVKFPSSRPIIDQNNRPWALLCMVREISHPLVSDFPVQRYEDLFQAAVPFNSYRHSPTSPRGDIEDR